MSSRCGPTGLEDPIAVGGAVHVAVIVIGNVLYGSGFRAPSRDETDGLRDLRSHDVQLFPGVPNQPR